MKNIYIKLGVCLLAAITLIACKKENELAFSPNSSVVSVNVGETTTLSVNSYGVKSSTPYPVSNVEWSVDDKFVASVDNNGLLTGLKDGVTRACGKFDGGKVVYIDVLVNSLNNQYLEPMLQGTFNEVSDYEAVLSARQFTRGVDSKYAVYKGTSDEYLDKFQIYFFNQFNGGVITCFENGDAVEIAKTKFLPDRYNVISENSFADNKNNKVETRADEFGYGVFYNFGDFSGKMSDVYAQYAADANSYLDDIANQENYTQEKLALKLPFVITADQTQVASYKQNAVNAISAGTNFGSAEAAIASNSELISELYLQSAREWAIKEWCWVLHSTSKGDVMNGGLRKGHVQEEYYEVAWDRILELDEQFENELAGLTSFAEIDLRAQTYGGTYMNIASTTNVKSNESKINSNFKTIQSKHKKEYNENCWNEMTALKDDVIEQMKTTIYSYSEMQTLVDRCSSNKYDTKIDESYYKDVPTIALIDANVAELDKAWSAYNESDYTKANWKLMVSTYESTLELLKNSVSKTESAEALAAAKQFFFNMPKK